MEAKRITLSEYCPARKVPLDLREILINQVNREAEINSYFMERNQYLGIDQMTAEDRLGYRRVSFLRKIENWWTDNLFKILAVMIAVAFIINSILL